MYNLLTCSHVPSHTGDGGLGADLGGVVVLGHALALGQTKVAPGEHFDKFERCVSHNRI
jgi:hypothetical protein